MENKGLPTTVVGSWPLSNSYENMLKAFNAMINIGIDYPCYPQLVSMINQFLSPLSKLVKPLEELNGEFFLKSDFKNPNKPIALEYGQFLVNFFKKNPNLKDCIKGTKACLTGPFTLASEIILKEKVSKGVKPQIFDEPRAIMVDWIIDKLAEIMKMTAKAYNDMGINIISMDEPILGLLVGKKIFFHSEDFIINTLDKALSEIKTLSSIHVCGRISPMLRDLLLQTSVKILDHEFASNERNFNVFEKDHFENNQKFLAMGCIKSNFSEGKSENVIDYVEDVNALIRYIKRGIDKFGKENLIIKPDCGFGALRNAFKDENFVYEIVLNKLKNMVIAVRQLK